MFIRKKSAARRLHLVGKDFKTLNLTLIFSIHILSQKTGLVKKKMVPAIFFPGHRI
jgi:hypothetical protein